MDIRLWKTEQDAGVDRPGRDFQPYLTPYLLDGDKPRAAVIVLPGGGYGCRAPHEGEPVAERFNRNGFHAFVLQYRVAPYVYPASQLDVLRAVKIVRSRAAEWHVRPEAIAVLGFSAGGHLACSSGILFDELDASAGDAADAFPARPDATVLCYPVISGVNCPHLGSFWNLLGGEQVNADVLKEYSWERRVKPDTPPSFIWHTADDQAVPVENSLNYAAALRAERIDFGLHIFPHGPHGIGLADDFEDAKAWPELAAAFLRRCGF